MENIYKNDMLVIVGITRLDGNYMNEFKVGDIVEDGNGNFGTILQTRNPHSAQYLTINFDGAHGIYDNIPKFMVKKVQPKFEEGEAVLIEAFIKNGQPDGDGDIEIRHPRHGGYCNLFIPLSKIRKMEQ